jgi:2,5-diamino-6-(ribosylamino)-4(3H)-pyrimidinone 5'-phosphate reductase
MGVSRPRVVIHTAVSADGRTDGFHPRIDVYYRLARSFEEDVTLTGADTILAASASAPEARPPAPPPSDGPVLAVTDSRGRVRDYEPLLGAGIWRSVLALCTGATPASHLTHLADAGIPAARCGTDRVDLAATLALLAREHDARTVRVDSG